MAVVDEVSDAGSDADDVDNTDGLPPSLTITPKLHIVTNKVTQFAITFIIVDILCYNASWKVLDSFLKIPGPGKSCKISLVLESPGN